MLKTKYEDLDNLFNESYDNSFIAIGSTDRELEIDLLFNLAYNMAVRSSGTIGMFNVLTSTERAIYKLVTLGSSIDFNKFAKGECTDKQCREVASTINELSETKIFLEDSISLISIDEFKNKCRNLKANHNVDVIFIDSIQMIRLDNLYKNFEDSKERIIRELKKIARELNITIISVFDLKENVEKRMDPTPMLIDFVEEIEYYAKTILVIYRDRENKASIHFRNVINEQEAKKEYTLNYSENTHKII